MRQNVDILSPGGTVFLPRLFAGHHDNPQKTRDVQPVLV